jgi:zinc protease
MRGSGPWRRKTWTVDSLRALERPRGPLSVRAEVATQTDKAYAISGFFGVERGVVRDERLLDMAAQVLTNRMIQTVREDRQLVYSIGAQSSAALEFPGYGMFFALSSTDPHKLDALLETLRGMYAEFAAAGPNEEEMQTVRKQIATMLDERMREPPFWTSVLSGMAYRDTNLQDVVDAPAAYQEYAAEAVREAFAKYFKPEASFEVSAAPKAAPPADDQAPPP